MWQPCAAGSFGSKTYEFPKWTPPLKEGVSWIPEQLGNERAAKPTWRQGLAELWFPLTPLPAASSSAWALCSPNLVAKTLAPESGAKCTPPGTCPQGSESSTETLVKSWLCHRSSRRCWEGHGLSESNFLIYQRSLPVPSSEATANWDDACKMLSATYGVCTGASWSVHTEDDWGWH